MGAWAPGQVQERDQFDAGHKSRGLCRPFVDVRPTSWKNFCTPSERKHTRTTAQHLQTPRLESTGKRLYGSTLASVLHTGHKEVVRGLAINACSAELPGVQEHARSS